MSAQRFTLMGYSTVSNWPTVKAVETRKATEVVEAAQAMLVEAAHFERVEIWSGQELVHTVHRRGGG